MKIMGILKGILAGTIAGLDKTQSHVYHDVKFYDGTQLSSSFFVNCFVVSKHSLLLNSEGKTLIVAHGEKDGTINGNLVDPTVELANSLDAQEVELICCYGAIHKPKLQRMNAKLKVADCADARHPILVICHSSGNQTTLVVSRRKLVIKLLGFGGVA